MKKNLKIMSTLAVAGILATSGLTGVAKAAADPTIATPVAGVYRTTLLKDDRKAVLFELASSDDTLTVKDLKDANLGDVTAVNGSTTVPADTENVGTGDTFVAGGETFTVVLYGDVNGSGTITAADATLVERDVAKIKELNEEQKIAGDVASSKANGKISSTDATWIRRWAAKLETDIIKEYPPEEEPDVLDTAKETAVAQLKPYKDYEKANSDAMKEQILGIITKAEEDINAAETKEDVENLLNKALEDIKSADSEIDDKMELLNDKKQDAFDNLQAYEDVLSEVEGLTPEDKTRVENIIKQAKKDIEAANSEEELTAAETKFSTLIGQYNNVDLEKTRKEAIAALEEHRDSSKPALEKKINEAIESIKKETNKETIKSTKNTTLKEIAPVETAQEKAYAYLKEYEDYLTANSSLSPEEKNIIRGEIETVKGLIANSDSVEEIFDNELTDLKEASKGAIKQFNDFMKGSYSEVVSGTELQAANNELQATYQNALTELSQYLSSSDENVKKVAEKARKAIEDAMETVEEDSSAEEVVAVTSKIKELLYGKGGKNKPDFTDLEADPFDISKVNDTDAAFRGYIGEKGTEADPAKKGALVYMSEKAAEKEAEDKQKCAAAKENAIEVLDLYQTVLNDTEAIEALELSQDDIASIQEMIDVTRKSVSSATKESEVNKAMELLRKSKGSVDGYLDTYYKPYADYANNYEFEHAKTSALAKLAEYKETYKEDRTLLSKIEAAITDINGYTAPTKTAADVNLKLTSIEDAIDIKVKSDELEAEKARAIKKYTEILEKSDKPVVQGKVSKAIEEISALKYDGGTNKKTPKDVQDIEKRYDEDLQDELAIIEKEKQDAYQEALKTAQELVNNYLDIATVTGNQTVINQLNNYKNLIASKKDAESVNAAKAELESYIEKSCQVLKAQKEAIDLLLSDDETNGYEKYFDGENADADVVAKVNEAIDKIKAITETDKSKGDEAITKIKDDLKTAVTEITTAKSNYKTKQKAALDAISEEISKYEDGTVQAALKDLVKDYEARIKAVPLDDKNAYETTFTTIKNEALATIEKYVKAQLVSEIKAADVSKTALNGTYKNKTIDELVKEELVVSGDKSSFNFSAGTLLPVEKDWTEFDTTNKTGYFLVLKIANKYAKAIDVKVEGGSDANKVVSDENGIYIVRVADLTESDNQTVTGGLKLKVEYYIKEKAAQPADATVEYDLSGIKLQKNITKAAVQGVVSSVTTKFNESTSGYLTYSTEGDDKTVCTIATGQDSKTMGEILSAVGQNFVDELKKAADKITKIKAEDSEVTVSATEVSLDNLKAVVKAAMKKAGVEAPSKESKLSDLQGKTLTFKIVGTDGEEFTYNVEFKAQE